MADILVLKYNASVKKEKHDEANDSIKFASFKTANYELTDTYLGELVGGGTASIHNHDDVYFTESEFVSSSAGAADSGKPVVLDADGNIDASMLNDADISHDSTSGAASSTVHTAFPLLVGGRDFTAIQSYDSAKTYTLDAQIVDKKYVDDTVANAVTLGEWQDSVLDIQADATLDPTASPATGARYLITDAAALHANFGSISGLADDDIVEYDGAAWVIAHSPTTGSRVGNDSQTDRLYFYSGSAWSAVYFESTTASLGCKKSGFDIQADLLASGGLKLNGNSIAVEPNDFAGEGLVDDGSDNLAIEWSTAFNDSKAIKASDLASTANGLGSSIIGIEDSAGLFDATNVEAALAEVMNQAKEGSGVEYTAGTGGIGIGDLVYVSAANTILPLSDLTSDAECVGVAVESAAAGNPVKVANFDSLIASAITGATAGDLVYWDGSAPSLTQPSLTDENVWVIGVAKNATDFTLKVDHRFKNP
jgi:hypothetical protein